MGKRTRSIGSLARFLNALEQAEEVTISDHTADQVTLINSSASPSQQPPKEEECRGSWKKRKVSLLSDAWAKYDASALVARYTDEYEVPDRLKKYYAQRERYFSLYSKGCLLDEEGWYSVTPERMADHIAERCRCDTILDAFCGVGGNAIAFARTCERVIALDISPTRLALARHNAVIYGVADRIDFILADYRDFARSYIARQRYKHSTAAAPSQNASTKPCGPIDVVFLSPPWGGPSYVYGSPQKTSLQTSKSLDTEDSEPIEGEYNLSSILPLPGDELFELTRKITPNIAYFLPKNTSLAQLSGLISVSTADTEKGKGRAMTGVQGMIEIEEEYMGGKLKALTCYFGELVGA